MSKNTEKILIHFDEVGQKALEQNIHDITIGLEEAVGLFSALEVGSLKPEDLFSLVQSSEATYSRYRSAQVDKENLRDSEQIKRPVKRSYTDETIVLPSPQGMFDAINNLGQKKQIFLNNPSLFELVKSKIHINMEVLKAYKEATYKVYVTDPKLIARYHLQKEWFNITEQFHAFLMANFPDERPMYSLVYSLPVKYMFEDHLKVNRETMKIEFNNARYLL